MITLYLNTITREWFDQNGNPLGMDMPTFIYGATEQIRIMLKSESPDAGTRNTDPSEWAVDTLYSGLSNLAAKVTIDSDYIHKIKGSVVGEIIAGSSTVLVRYDSGVTLAHLPSADTLWLFAADGSSEALSYISRTKVDDGFLFTLADGVTVNIPYESGAMAVVNQSPYCSAYYEPDLSSPTAGAWTFDLTVVSPRLRDAMEYSNRASLDIKGLELLLYTISDDGVEQPIQAFLLETAAIVGTLGAVGGNAEPSEYQRNEIAAIVAAMISEGIDTESRFNESTLRYELRIKLSRANTDSWSDWVEFGAAPQIQYSPDNSTWQDAADDLTKYIRFSLDGGESWGAGMLVKGADGADGYTPIKGTDYYTESDKTELLTELKSYVDNSIANGEW